MDRSREHHGTMLAFMEDVAILFAADIARHCGRMAHHGPTVVGSSSALQSKLLNPALGSYATQQRLVVRLLLLTEVSSRWIEKYGTPIVQE